MTGADRGDLSPRKRQALELFEGLPRHYDLVAALFSFGQDPRWRRTMVREVGVGAQDRVLDVASGTGLVAAALVRAGAREVVALDQSDAMLARARSRVRADPDLAGRVQVIAAQAEQLPFADGEFDALTFTYLLRYVDDPAATLRELARVVRRGGRVASLDFYVPPRLPARVAWRLYTRIGLPLLGRLVSRDWRRAGSFLGPNIEQFYRRHPLTDVIAMWEDAGIEQVQARPMSVGGGVVMWGVRR